MVNEPSSRKTQEAEDSNFDEKEFKEFLNILRITEEFPDTPTDEEKAVSIDKYLAWVEDGKPKPSLGERAPKVEKILRLYRRKANGKQYLSYVVEGKSEQVGMATDITYGETPGGQEDRSLIIGRTRHPTIPYNEKEARALLKKAKRYTESVQLRLVFLGQVITIHNEENFFKEFDEVIELVNQKKVV